MQLAEKVESRPLPIRRIIAAVNPSKKREATVRYAGEIAGRYDATLYLCYVFWPSPHVYGTPSRSIRTQGQHYDS